MIFFGVIFVWSAFFWDPGYWGDTAARPLKHPRDQEMMEHIASWVHEHGYCHDYYVELPEDAYAVAYTELQAARAERTRQPE